MWPTIIIAAVIGAIFVAIVVKEIINKKKGKHSCSCGCGTDMVSISIFVEDIARIMGANPKTNCINSSTMATERRYLTLNLLKISKIFRNFADESAKRYAGWVICAYARVF